MRGTISFGFTCAAMVALAGACGGAEDSSLLGDSGNTGTDSGGSDGGGSDTSTSCDVSRCATIPSGFHAVRLTDKGNKCPDQWTSTDVVSAPTATPDACSCACNVTTQPDCDTGDVTRFFDSTSTATCGSQGFTVTANNGACGSIGGQLFLNQFHYAVNPTEPGKGVCQYDPTLDAKKVTATPGLVCAPPSSCVGAICDGAVCVAQDGDVSCPQDFPNKTLVGASASADCAACTGGACTVGGTCTGALSLFTDDLCTTGKVDFTADGVCKANPTSAQGPYLAYTYTGTVKSATCSGPSPTSAATAKLTAPSTVCCRN